jgi:phage terminase large subunit
MGKHGATEKRLRGGEVRLMDYYEASGEGLPHYVNVLSDKQRDHRYVCGEHWAPHDIQVRELGTGKSRREIAASLGINFQIVRRHELADGINAVRLLLPRRWFDANMCARGIEALRQYRKQLNPRLQEFTGTPARDGSSHAADAFRGLAVRHQTPEAPKPPEDQCSYRFPSECGWMDS